MIANDILLSLDRGDNLFLLLLDLSAAFDTVNHSLLLWCLEKSFGITGTVLQWFHSYLSRRSQFVEINDIKSSVRDLTVGVLQGSVLGPILYLLYTTPLAGIIRSHGLDYHLFKKQKTFSVFLSSYRNTSGGLREREMLWEHKPQASVSTAFSSSPKPSRVFL